MSGMVLSLFPGIDLFGRAFEEEGFTVVRGPDPLWGGDIRRFHVKAGWFSGVIGGPPCQAFSALRHLVRATGKQPRHGNMIPEYERVVSEAAPSWFVMENVPPAPVPLVAGYAVEDFVLCPTWLGEAQKRKRRFSFGVLGDEPVDLRRFIEYAALELPDAAQAVTADGRAVPVAIGGSGKIKASTVISGNGFGSGPAFYKQRAVRGKNDGNPQPWAISHGRASPTYRRSWAERCALQGLPPTFLEAAPFTSAGKDEVLGNGVPLPMGRAVAQAVKRALGA